MEKVIRIEYFAGLREQRGCSEEVVHTLAQTPRELYSELQGLYRFDLSVDLMRVAVNEQFSDWQILLKSNDRVIFLPPVSGG